MRFLALGDSYTIGEGVAEADRWPNQLVRALRSRGIAVDPPQLIARTAWTSDELADAITAARVEHRFDVVSLLVGVNDQYRGRPVTAFEPEFAQLLQRAIGFANDRAGHVFALSIPDWGATPFAEGRDRALVTREIGMYNESGERLARAAGVRWFDVTTITREMLRDPSLVAPDGLHPSSAMYARWAELLLPHVVSVMRQSDATSPADPGEGRGAPHRP